MSLVFTFYHQGQRVSPHSNLTHDTSLVPVPLVRSEAKPCPQSRRALTHGQIKRLLRARGGRARRSLGLPRGRPTSWHGAKGDERRERLGGRAHGGPAPHKGSGVYSRQFSFLPTIMRGIESQEMFVFLSIRPNNNIIPCRFTKTSVFKGQSRK